MAIFATDTAVQHDGQDYLKELMHGRDTRWYRGHLAKLNLILFLLVITSAGNGFDGSMMNGLQSLNTWKDYFGNPTGGTLGLFNAIQSIGGIAGLPFGPFLADRYGRRLTIFVGCFIMLIGIAIQTAAQNVGMFIGCRFLIGFGLAIAGVAAPILITELAFPTHRSGVTSLYNSSWYLGAIIAGWSTYGTFRIPNTWAWRIPSVLQAIAPGLQFALIWFIPESPRWLIDHGKDDKAIDVLSKYHCGGNSEDPLIEFEYQEIREALRLEKEAKKNSTYLSLFQTKGNLKRMRVIIAIAFFSQWSGNGIVSYYFTVVLDGIGITGEGDKLLINGILQVYNYATAIFGALTADRFGRRTLFLTSTAGMCASFVFWTICNSIYFNTATIDAAGNPVDGNTSAGRGVLAFIFIYYGFYNIALSPLLVSYTVEILPFRIRAKGLMVMQMCVNASLVFNQYVNPIAMESLKWKYYIVYCCWIAFEFVYLYFTVIETKGPNGTALPLEEIAALFDGKDGANTIANSAANAQASGLTGGGVDENKGDEKAHVEDGRIERTASLH